MKKHLYKNIRTISTLAATALLIVGLISACNILGIGDEEEEPEGPLAEGILAPPESVSVLVGSPVQIQSAHPNGDTISRVELLVRRENEETDTRIRSDTLQDGVVVQQWIPQEVGLYTLKVRGIRTAVDTAPTEFTQQIRVLDNEIAGIALAEAGQPPVRIEPTKVVATPAPPPTPAEVRTEGDAAFVVGVAVAPEPTPTPIPRYPPPPPAPGVPWGPTQEELANFHPPICDAAEFIEVFVPDRGRRVSVAEPDDVAVKTVAGTAIHRAWRLRNIGTCTWGPGYELAFYGGRAMGSGGVAFESAYPSDAPRRNTLVDNSRLIVPEGKPNQTAVLELLLNVPTTPGVHQSYWRMRNPHGVYFGPILGVTLDVIRECGFSTNDQRVYGAPVINRFVILGVGDVYRPVDPVNVLAQLGESIVLEWNIINATNFDIVFEDPTGDIETRSTTDTNSRATFQPTTLGEHRITLFADNGVCTAEATVFVDVLPPDEERFRLDIILASNAPVSSADAAASFSTEIQAGLSRLEWEHFDPAANQFFLIAQGQRRVTEDYCVPLTDYCYPVFSEWRDSGRIVLELEGEAGQANTATVANVVEGLCPETSASEQVEAEHRIIYQMQAFADGQPAEPEFSNEVEVFCTATSTLPKEIR